MSKLTYFQYQKELNIPIYLSVDLSSFEPSFGEFITELKFYKLNDKEEAAALVELKKSNDARILHFSEASLLVAKQINGIKESDYYGAESITPKDGHRVYRYKDIGLMVYSFMAKEWKFGCYKDFGSAHCILPSRIIINRFLSWALIPYGIVGFWGVKVDDSMVAQKVVNSNGEAVFIDIKGQRIITVEGVKKLRPEFKILRLDPTLKRKNIRMSSEELLCFLSAHCSYFDSSGLSVPVRQMIQALSQMTVGLLHPEESFRPRIDLSL
jgi:hypothetical protein